MPARLKHIALRIASVSGASRVLEASTWRRNRLLILCYHGISMYDEHEWDPMLYVSQTRFRERMKRLHEGNYTVLPLGEGVRRMYDGTLPQRSVAITFDDGARDFAEGAVPVLAEFGLPATVYLTTYYSEFQRPVFDTALRYILWKSGAATIDATDLLPGGGTVSIRGRDEGIDFMLRVRAEASKRGLSGADKDALLCIVADRVGVNLEALRRQRLLHIMSPDEVARLPRDLIDVQLHTHRHRMPREEAALRREIRDNRVAIADLTGGRTNAEHFCYPSGYFEHRFLPWLREEGVTTATTCIPGFASPKDDPLLLPRFLDTMNVPDLVFDAWLAGTAALLPRRDVPPPPGA